jgi:hypothetical protein
VSLRVACAVAALAMAACSGSGATNANGSDGGGDATVGAGDDAGGTGDGAPSSDDGGGGSEAAVGCGAFAGDPVFTCSGDGNERGKCVNDASLDEEPCANGCLRVDAGDAGLDSICMGDAADWSCTGNESDTPAQDGNYYVSEFGCWVDADGGAHTDPDDNCIPSCFDQAKAAGLCDPNGTGADCEEKLDWYTADGTRFGCLQRLRVTNPLNGKSLIAIALDFGPACTGEAKVSHAVLDSSGRIDDYLFGGPKGGVDMALVHVVEVDDTTPLGPIEDGGT